MLASYTLKGAIVIDSRQHLETAIREFIENLGEDITRDGLLETPRRFTKQLAECLSGYSEDPEAHVKVFDNDGNSDLITISDITFASLCEHHLATFYGTIDVAYVPNKKILGLSKFARIADTLSRRLQVQERLTHQMADVLEKCLKPKMLIVRIQAKHMCMGSRGVRRLNANTETITIRGNAEKYHYYIEQLSNRSRERDI
jgi:GTP cyclohydrolase IA